MYNLIKNVITNGNYELASLLKKIEAQWLQGNLTDDERNELVRLAQDKANMQNSLDLYKKLEELDKRVKVLEEAKEDDTTGDSEEGTAEDAADYEVGKWYYAGDKVSFDGKTYKCVAPDGVVCVWSPTEYPAYWELAE